MNGRWMSLLLGAVLAAFLLSGCAATPDNVMPQGGKDIPETVQKTPEPAQMPDADKVPVKVYFGAPDAENLKAVIYRIKNDELLPKRAMQILVAGPQSNGLWAVLPPTTNVNSVIVKERIAYVDFSEEIVNPGFGGSSREILAVGAIVNTLTELPEVERVQILVDGKKRNTLFGHMDISGPLSRSPGIIPKD